MKIKLDESLGERGRLLLAAAGHDVCTVPHQALTSADDRQLIEVCRRESRALVTLDMDFANALVYPPAACPGIAVIRLSKRATAADLQAGLQTLVGALAVESLAGRLWIVAMCGCINPRRTPDAGTVWGYGAAIDADSAEYAEPGAKQVVPMASRKAVNLRTHLERIIAKAGHEAWPRIFQNLRASCATGWVERYPSHVVAK